MNLFFFEENLAGFSIKSIGHNWTTSFLLWTGRRWKMFIPEGDFEMILSDQGSEWYRWAYYYRFYGAPESVQGRERGVRFIVVNGEHYRIVPIPTKPHVDLEQTLHGIHNANFWCSDHDGLTTANHGSQHVTHQRGTGHEAWEIETRILVRVICWNIFLGGCSSHFGDLDHSESQELVYV